MCLGGSKSPYHLQLWVIRREEGPRVAGRFLAASRLSPVVGRAGLPGGQISPAGPRQPREGCPTRHSRRICSCRKVPEGVFRDRVQLGEVAVSRRPAAQRREKRRTHGGPGRRKVLGELLSHSRGLGATGRLDEMIPGLGSVPRGLCLRFSVCRSHTRTGILSLSQKKKICSFTDLLDKRSRSTLVSSLDTCLRHC